MFAPRGTRRVVWVAITVAGMAGCLAPRAVQRTGVAPSGTAVGRSATQPSKRPPPLIATGSDGRPRFVERPDGLTDTTADVLARFRAPDAPDEVFLLDTYYPGGGPGHAVEITVRRGEAELRWYERRPDRYFARPVSPQELDALRRFVISRGTDRLPPRELAGFDGIEHVYVHALPHAAYHVLINNPGEDGGVYTELVAWFDRLADPARLRVRYTGRQLPNGAEVLWASPVDVVSGVHAAGEDIRVFVGRRGSTEGSWRSLTPTGLGDEVEPPVSRPAGPPGTASSRRVNAGRNYAWHDVSTDRMYVVADGNLFRVPASRFAHAEWDW